MLVSMGALLCGCGGTVVEQSGALVDPGADATSLTCTVPPSGMTESESIALACGGPCLPATCANGACTPELYADMHRSMLALAVDSDYLYFSSKEDHVIRRTPIHAMAVQEVVTIGGYARGLVVSGGRLFWTSVPEVEGFQNGEVASMKLPDGPAVVLAEGGALYGIAATKQRAIWADFEHGLMMIPQSDGVAQGTAVPFGGYTNAGGVWIADGTLFWTQVNVDRSIRTRSVEQEHSERLLACNQQWPGSIVVDDKRAYWINRYIFSSTGRVMAMDRGGGNPRVMVDGRNMPGAMTGNAEALYWVENFTTLMTMTK